MSSRILLVEDAPDVQLIVADLLRGHGHEVVVSGDGGEGLRVAGEQQFDLMILDVMLPGLSGFELCRAVRERGFDGAILMLTARAQVDDRVEGLAHRSGRLPHQAVRLEGTAGARERAASPLGKDAADAGLAVSVRRCDGGFRAPRGDCAPGVPVNLAAKELQLLRQLIDHRGQVLSRERLLSRVWHDQPFIGPRTVDVHIAWLRQKLEENPQTPRHIVTVRGEGYSFEP